MDTSPKKWKFYHTYVIPHLYDFLSAEHKRYFAEYR